MAEADLGVAHIDMKNADKGVARALPHSALRIGLRLLVPAEEFSTWARGE